MKESHWNGYFSFFFKFVKYFPETEEKSHRSQKKCILQEFCVYIFIYKVIPIVTKPNLLEDHALHEVGTTLFEKHIVVWTYHTKNLTLAFLGEHCSPLWGFRLQACYLSEPRSTPRTSGSSPRAGFCKSLHPSLITSARASQTRREQAK